ncbi:MAG: hypothetical protein HZA00_07005 [Nitrospinae bacterium]|nr:hypothetical protein [Nitrospinota bacterium]
MPCGEFFFVFVSGCTYLIIACGVIELVVRTIPLPFYSVPSIQIDNFEICNGFFVFCGKGSGCVYRSANGVSVYAFCKGYF